MAEALALALACLEERPESAARSLESLSAADAAALLELVPVRIAAPAMSRMTSWAAARCIAVMPVERASAVIGQLESHDALAVLRQMPAAVRDSVLTDLPAATARHYRRALTYGRSRVGAWVNHDLATAGEDHTAGEALDMIVTRRRLDDAALYVLDGMRRYVGTVSLAALLHAPPGNRLAALARRQRTLSDSASLAAAASEVSWSTSIALPVIDQEGELLGDLSRADLEKGLSQSRAEEPLATGPSVIFHLTETYLAVIGELARIPSPAKSDSDPAKERRPG